MIIKYEDVLDRLDKAVEYAERFGYECPKADRICAKLRSWKRNNERQGVTNSWR